MSEKMKDEKPYRMCTYSSMVHITLSSNQGRRKWEGEGPWPPTFQIGGRGPSTFLDRPDRSHIISKRKMIKNK